MGRLDRVFITVLVLGLTAACARTNGTTHVLEPKTEPAEAAAQKGESDRSRAFIWKATRTADTAKTVYLVGSVHVARSDWYPLDPVFQRAYDDSDALVVEVDLTETDPVEMHRLLAQYAVLEDGKTLKDVLSESTWQKLVAFCREKSMSIETVATLKPWFLSMTIVLARFAQQGYTAEHGIDVYFLSLGDKTVLSLETARYQLELFDNFEPKLQELLLLDAMEGKMQTGGDIEALGRAWNSGDAEALVRILDAQNDEPEVAPLREKLFDERNRKMAGGLEQLLQTYDTLFVVVGAGHVVGPEGLLDLLGRSGFEVVQLERIGSM